PDRRPGVTSWLGRVFSAVSDATAAGSSEAEEPEALVRLTHRTIKAVTSDLDRFRFNVAISKLMVLTNAIRSALDAGGGARGGAGGKTAPNVTPVTDTYAAGCYRRFRASPGRSPACSFVSPPPSGVHTRARGTARRRGGASMPATDGVGLRERIGALERREK